MSTTFFTTYFEKFGRAPRDFFRYVATGLSLFIVDLCVFLALVNLGEVSPGVSQFVSRATGAIVGFFAHRHFTFRESVMNPRYNVLGQGGGYVIVGLVTLMLSPFLLVLILSFLQEHLVAAKILTEIVIVIGTFLSLRFVFRGRGS